MAQMTLKDLETSYDEAIKRAAGSAEAVSDLKAEKATAIAEFRLKEVAIREQALWKREALQKWPSKAMEALLKRPEPPAQ